MEYKKNIYLFLIFDFLTNLSPLSFIYALFLKQQNMSLTQIGFIISVYQISKLIFEVPSGVFSDKYGRMSIPLSEVHAICYRSPHNPLKKSIFFKS